MVSDLVSFEVYAPARGNALVLDGDGSATLRLRVPPQDRAAVLALLDALGAGDGACVRLVAVSDE